MNVIDKRELAAQPIPDMAATIRSLAAEYTHNKRR